MFLKDALITKLTAECGYSPAGAAALAQKCEAMPPELQKMVRHWLDSGLQTDLSCGNYSVQMLMRERGFSYVNALNVIWWLQRDHEAAEAALKKPVHRIIRGPRHD